VIDDNERNKLVVEIRLFSGHLRVRVDTWQIERLQVDFTDVIRL